MTNELLLLTHIAVITGMVLLSFRLGAAALVAFMCSSTVIANLFVLKQISIFGLDATGSDAYIIASILSFNLLHEFYGKSDAQKAIWISFLSLIFYTIVSQFQIAYIACPADTTQPHFVALLTHMPRITLASLGTYFFVQQVDFFLYDWLRTRFSDGHLVLRNYIAIGLTQILDTVMFTYLGLYGIVERPVHIIAVSLMVKLGVMLLVTPIVGLARHWYKPVPR